MNSQNISKKNLAANTILNFIGQAIPALVGIIAIPAIIHGLGKEKFGLLSLIWVVLGYSVVFDLGFGRSATKYIAEAIGKNARFEISRLFWTTVWVQLILALLSAIVVFNVVPVLIGTVIKVSPGLMAETRNTFYLLPLAIPIILLSSSFSGALEAINRFDLINAIKMPSSVLLFLIPMIGGILDLKLNIIVLFLIISKACSAIAFSILALITLPELKHVVLVDRMMIFKLFAYGGWVTISNFLAPCIRYLDRFIIGALLSTAMVGYYTAPFDIMERLWILPTSLVLTLFPTFSMLSGSKNFLQSQRIFLQSLKYLFIIAPPIVLVLYSFSPKLITLWLGADFAGKSLLTFQILLGGALIGLFAPIAGSILQGYDHPDIIAKVYMITLPINTLMVWILVKNIGLPGAAVSLTIRTFIETIVLVLVALPLIRLSIREFVICMKKQFAITFFMILTFLLLTLVKYLIIKILLTIVALLVFAIVIWTWILTDEEKKFIPIISKRGLK